MPLPPRIRYGNEPWPGRTLSQSKGKVKNLVILTLYVSRAFETEIVDYHG
jgi:hypothetical protein